MKNAGSWVLLALVLPSVASAARIAPASVTASSSYPEEDGVNYEPGRASDGKVSTAWVEGDQGSGLGAWLQLDLGGEKTIQKVRVWTGLWYSREYWARANRPKEIEFQYSDGGKDTFVFKDEMKVQEFALPQARKTSYVKVRLKSVYDGSTWLDTAISEIQVFDAAPETSTVVRGVSASSVLPADADGSYDPANISDGLYDSMWCEGNKAGDGTNEWLEVQFAGSQPVSKLTVVNGIGTSLPFWMKGNRAATATLRFSDGSSEQVTLKNSITPQTVTFAAHTTSSVRITFNSVVKGKEFNDLCISEASFGE